MIKAEKEKKKFQSRIPFILGPRKKIPKGIAKKFKKLKNPFPALFLSKTGWDKPGKREKNFSPEFRSHPSRVAISKKNSKKIQKTEKHHSDTISIQTGRRQTEKEREKFLSRIPFILESGKKISKKIANNFKNLKKPFPALFLAKTR